MKQKITIAVTGGSSGRGRILVAANLSTALTDMGLKVTYLDCDVENALEFHYLNPNWYLEFEVEKRVPEIDPERCSHCGECTALCQFNAIADLGDSVLTFPNRCYSCGACVHFCPSGAISETLQSTGRVRLGYSGTIRVVDGRINIGERHGESVIQAVRQQEADSGATIITAGTSGLNGAVLRNVDHVILVMGATPFGIHEYHRTAEYLKQIKIPFSTVIKNDGIGDQKTAEYCRRLNIPVLMQLPPDLDNTAARPVDNHLPETDRWIMEQFHSLGHQIMTERAS